MTPYQSKSYAKPFLPLQYNPLLNMTPIAHNVSIPELSMISNNDTKEPSNAIVEGSSDS